MLFQSTLSSVVDATNFGVEFMNPANGFSSSVCEGQNCTHSS